MKLPNINSSKYIPNFFSNKKSIEIIKPKEILKTKYTP